MSNPIQAKAVNFFANLSLLSFFLFLPLFGHLSFMSVVYFYLYSIWFLDLGLLWPFFVFFFWPWYNLIQFGGLYLGLLLKKNHLNLMTNTIYGLFCCFGTFFLNFIVLFDLFKSLSLAKTRMVLKIIFSPLIFLVLILAFLAFLGLPLKKNFLSLMRLRMVLKTIFGKKLLFLILTLFGHF